MLSLPCVPYYTVHTRCLKTDRPPPPRSQILATRERDRAVTMTKVMTILGHVLQNYPSSAFTQTFVGSQRWDTPAERDQEHRNRPNDPHQIARRCEEECQDDRS